MQIQIDKIKKMNQPENINPETQNVSREIKDGENNDNI